MSIEAQARHLMELYPRVFFACHLRHRRDPASGDELSSHQGSILDHLDERDGTRIGELARHMGVTAGTMSIHIDRLERKGYVSRAADPDDGRRVLVRLTRAGVRVKEANSVLDPSLVEALLERMDVVDRPAAIEGLQLLARGAERLMSDRAEGSFATAGPEQNRT